MTITNLASGEIKDKVQDKDAGEWFVKQKLALTEKFQNACDSKSTLQMDFQENIAVDPEECSEGEVQVFLYFKIWCQTK